MVPRINLAPDQGEWSVSRPRTVHSVSTAGRGGGGGHSRFGRSEKKTLLPTIETKSPRMSGLLPSPHTDSVNPYLTNVENRVSS